VCLPGVWRQNETSASFVATKISVDIVPLYPRKSENLQTRAIQNGIWLGMEGCQFPGSLAGQYLLDLRSSNGTYSIGVYMKGIQKRAQRGPYDPTLDG
jgi:hypothetical protein